jgi:perosamine synthetase
VGYRDATVIDRVPVVEHHDRIIPVSEPTLTGNDDRYVVECVRSNWISSAGAFVPRFEGMFAQCCGTRFAASMRRGAARPAR